jgi:hypothetical protein
MTAIGLSGPEPFREAASGRSSVGGSVRLPPGAREPSLLELVSLSDWYRFVPESLGILLLIVIARTLLPDVSSDGVMPHPFWIPVLLMSGQYGIMGGLFATLAATGALFLSGLPPSSATQDFYAYAGVVAAQPCAWLATALVMGGLRTLHIHLQTDLKERLTHTELVAEELADWLGRAVGEIERLEQRIAADASTLGSFLHNLAELQLADRRSFVESVSDLVRYGVGATDFAIYLEGEQGLEPYLCVEGGARVAPTAITRLPPRLLNAVRGEDIAAEATTGEDWSDGMPCWAPIRLGSTGEAVGVVICNRLEPTRDPAIAVRRVKEVSRLLSTLLPYCMDGRSGVCGCSKG